MKLATPTEVSPARPRSVEERPPGAAKPRKHRPMPFLLRCANTECRSPVSMPPVCDSMPCPAPPSLSFDSSTFETRAFRPELPEARAHLQTWGGSGVSKTPCLGPPCPVTTTTPPLSRSCHDPHPTPTAVESPSSHRNAIRGAVDVPGRPAS
ncbi:hypothetical protein AAFF_G00060570 [Aldrovandia affinis]|uniref:Uncharacterized protein n=1 Tax=Aldrovandia affinis TaxID=143900 RepID=A0AAD7WF24_9TELE|nr:hypothetical protein AAFF_G00060570 [Aldrovandia affinis]